MCGVPWLGRDCMQLGAANRVTRSAIEELYCLYACERIKGEYNPTSWTRFVPFDISNTRHARALFLQVSCISIGQTKVALRGCDPGTARGQKAWKMNVDFVKRSVFLEWATFLEHSRRNFADRMARGRAISPNLCTMFFGTPCLLIEIFYTTSVWMRLLTAVSTAY